MIFKVQICFIISILNLLISSISFCQSERDSVLIFYEELSNTELKYWSWVNENSLGIDGSTPGTNKINRYPAIKFTRANWLPVDGYKHTLRGKIIDFKGHKGEFLHDYEEDWNIHVMADSNFNYLVNYPYLITQSTCQWFSYNDTLVIECEITPNHDFSYSNKYFQLGERSFLPELDFLEDILGNQIEGSHPNWNDRIEGLQFCFYGPWVREKLHDFRPEIHPIQLVWFKNKREKDSTEFFTIIGLEDITDYFDGAEDYFTDDTTFSVWSGNGLQTEYKIAFKVNRNKESVNLKIRLPDESLNFNNLEELNIFMDTANKYISKYNYKDKESMKNLVNIQVDDKISKYVRVGLKDVRILNDTIFGFVTLNVTIKKNIVDKGSPIDAGYYVFNIESKKIINDSIDQQYIINNIINKQIANEKQNTLKVDVLIDNKFYKNTIFNHNLDEVKFISNNDTIETMNSQSKELYLKTSTIFDTGYVKYRSFIDSVVFKKYKPLISKVISNENTNYAKESSRYKFIKFADTIIFIASPIYTYSEKNIDTVSKLLLNYLNDAISMKNKEEYLKIFKSDVPFQIKWDTFKITNYDEKEEVLDMENFRVEIHKSGEELKIVIPNELNTSRLIFNVSGRILDVLGDTTNFSSQVFNFVSTKEKNEAKSVFLPYYNKIFGDLNGRKMLEYAYLNDDSVTKLDIIDSNYVKARILKVELEREFFDRPNGNIRYSLMLNRLKDLGQ